MTAKRKEQKKEYDTMKDIRTRMQNGEPTTFAERNKYYMYEKKRRKKLKKDMIACS